MRARVVGSQARGDRDVFCARVIKGFFFLRLGVSASKADYGDIDDFHNGRRRVELVTIFHGNEATKASQT